MRVGSLTSERDDLPQRGAAAGEFADFIRFFPISMAAHALLVWIMLKRQWIGALITMAIVVGFIAAVVLRLFTVAVCILLGALGIAYVLGIAWMRTNPSARQKQSARVH